MGFRAKMLSKCKKIVYSLTLFGVRYKRFVELECKQNVCGFPEDKNSNRRKVLIHEFHKNCLKWSAKRQIRSKNCDSRIANSSPADYQKFVWVGDLKWEIVEITIRIIFLLEIHIYCFLYREFSSPAWKKSPPPKMPIPTHNLDLT